MKILYFATNFPYYSETFVLEEINQLRECGHQVEVCNLTWFKKEQKGLGFEVLNNSKNPLWLVTSVIRNLLRRQSQLLKPSNVRSIFDCIVQRPEFFIKYLYLWASLDFKLNQVKEKSFDLAISHFLFKSTLAAHILCKNIGVPLHIRLHTKRTLYPNKLLCEVLESSATITAESNDVGQFFKKKSGNKKIKVVRQSINLKNLSSISKQEDKHIKVVAIGRLVPKKGFDTLIEAFILGQNSFPANTTLSIYGDGPLRESLQHKIDEQDNQKDIFLMGQTNHQELMSTLANAHLLVAPSIELENDVDGIPTVIAEAMSVKTPVLSTIVAGISELIIEGETGFTFTPNDAQELASRLSELLSDEILRTDVVDKAYTMVAQEYGRTLASELEDAK